MYGMAEGEVFGGGRAIKDIWDCGSLLQGSTQVYGKCVNLFGHFSRPTLLHTEGG
jgi:hypothetical protein